jgi:hypothetical protein
MPDSLSPYADPPLVRGADGWAPVQGEPPGPIPEFTPADTDGPTVQVGHGMLMHPDREEVIWLAADDKGVGLTVAGWLALVQHVRELEEGVTRVAPAPGWHGSLEAAWGLIANAGGGNWDSQTLEWREAASRWRDAYHDALDAKTAQPVAAEDQDAPWPDWSVRMEVLRILAGPDSWAQPAQLLAAARALLTFVTGADPGDAEPADLLPGQTGGPPLGPDLDYAWCERIAERTKVDLGAVALIIGAHLELQQEAR